MSILPILSAREVLRRLHQAGFRVVSQRGSHIKLWNPTTGHRTGVPFHNVDIGRNLLSKILKQAGLSMQEFIDL